MLSTALKRFEYALFRFCAAGSPAKASVYAAHRRGVAHHARVTPVDATNNSRRMQAITLGGNPAFTLPALNFAPTAAGIDARKVTDRGILPVINTGIAHKQAGVGQIGAGITTAPMACFVAAVRALAEIVAKENHHG